MGRRIETLKGILYLDSNCFIYGADHVEPYNTTLNEISERARQKQFAIATSELTLMETLVKPFKMRNANLEQTFRDALQNAAEVSLVPVSVSILEQAARLRATMSIKTPDAIHAATGLAVACSCFITNDAAFRRVAGLPATLISEIEL